MDIRRRLAEVVLSAHPREAARVVETLAPDVRAKVLGAVASTDAARVVTEMAPHAAHEAFTHLTESQVALIAEAMSTTAVAGILRRMTTEQCTSLLRLMAKERTRALEVLLEQRKESVGAYADPDVIVLPATVTAQEAISANAEALINATYEIPVVAQDGRLVGVVSLQTLSGAANSARTDTLVLEDAPVLLATRSIVAALDAPEWEGRSSLPVVDVVGAFVGLVRHETLRHATHRMSTDGVPRVSTSVALGEVFGTAVGGMLEAIVSASGRGDDDAG